MISLCIELLKYILLILLATVSILSYIIKFSRPLPDIIITNIHKKYSGVTSTIINLYPEQQKTMNIGILGNSININEHKVSFIDLIYYGYQLPPGKKFRLFHVRRNNELFWAIMFRDLFKIPIKIIFTSVKINKFSFISTLLIKNVDYIIVTLDKCITRLPCPEKVIKVIPHGINVSYFKPSDSIVNSVDFYNLKNKFVVSTFGRVRKTKGTDIFVKSLIKIMHKYPNVIALIVGETDSRNIFFKNTLTNLIHKNGLTNRFIFTGYISYINDPIKHSYIYHSTNLCVSVPSYEGFGLTPLEAMACGIPTICSNMGAFYTMIDEGKTGNLIPVGNVDELSKNIDYYINNKHRLIEMKQYCVDKVNTDFTISREAFQINNVYNEVFNK